MSYGGRVLPRVLPTHGNRQLGDLVLPRAPEQQQPLSPEKHDLPQPGLEDCSMQMSASSQEPQLPPQNGAVPLQLPRTA